MLFSSISDENSTGVKWHEEKHEFSNDYFREEDVNSYHAMNKDLLKATNQIDHSNYLNNKGKNNKSTRIPAWCLIYKGACTR